MSDNQTVYTRPDYMTNKCKHEQYYAQFVTPNLIAYVCDNIGLRSIEQSIDERFNDIPLKLWDNLHAVVMASCRKIAHGDTNFNTLSTSVCIAKEAARQVREHARKTHTVPNLGATQ